MSCFHWERLFWQWSRALPTFSISAMLTSTTKSLCRSGAPAWAPIQVSLWKILITSFRTGSGCKISPNSLFPSQTKSRTNAPSSNRSYTENMAQPNKRAQHRISTSKSLSSCYMSHGSVHLFRKQFQNFFDWYRVKHIEIIVFSLSFRKLF